MAQQTAVEWLKMKLEDIHSQSKHVNPYNPEPISYNYIMFLIDYAKQMEKEQMKNIWGGGKWSVELGGEFEQYYNETYNK